MWFLDNTDHASTHLLGHLSNTLEGWYSLTSPCMPLVSLTMSWADIWD